MDRQRHNPPLARVIARRLPGTSNKKPAYDAPVCFSCCGPEVTDAIGHVIINVILAILWCWTLSLYLSPAKTIRLILIGGLIWCVGAELTQHWVPNRGASLLDLGANILGVLIGLVGYRLLSAQ
ncbi:MAG: VanZ family protein [Chloroflexi bacterium]|nr:VanZ family protein [Chloroflexota bacterium]